MHRTGKIWMLALTNPTRLAGAPDIPTAAEQGFPGITSVGTIGIAAPAKTPKAIIEQIAQATRTALADKAYQQRLIESGFEVSSDTTPEKFRQSLKKISRSGSRLSTSSASRSTRNSGRFLIEWMGG